MEHHRADKDKPRNKAPGKQADRGKEEQRASQPAPDAGLFKGSDKTDPALETTRKAGQGTS